MPHTIRVLFGLFDGLPHVMFCMKDGDGRYVMVNQAFADRAKRATPADVVGLRAHDLFPTELATSYDAQDRHVLATGRPVRNQLELVLRPDGTLGWYLTNKVALTDGDGRCTGLASLSIDLRSPEGGSGFEGLAAVVETVHARFTEPLTVDDLAEAGGMSSAQLERRMRRVLGMSAKQFLLRRRLEHAAVLLSTTQLSIADIAARCGYYDQSNLTHQFRRVVGLTPGEYRTRFGERAQYGCAVGGRPQAPGPPANR